jgi:hypothetical protein
LAGTGRRVNYRDVVVVPARQPQRLASGAIVAGCEVDYLARNADRGLKISTDVLSNFTANT